MSIVGLNYPTTFMLSSQVYRDMCNQDDQSYRNIVTINLMPAGPLARFVRRIQLPYLSPFQFGGSGGDYSGLSSVGKQCVLALISLRGIGSSKGYGQGNRNNGLMDVSEVPDLFSFLLSNGYKIDTSLTKMMNSNDIFGSGSGVGVSSIAFITYTG
uniref:Uncharacterized protein n=1 Tax=viral metagenome TaxID=1070528 RepID=A0A6C0HWP7_9ZZZZ